MSVFINGRTTPQTSQLGPRSRHVLGLIDGGHQWLQWAIDSPEHRYSFADEGALLDGIQQGLHGSRLAWLPQVGLQVSPIKLLSLDNDDLDVLRRQEHGEHNRLLANEVQEVLDKYDLLTNTALMTFRPFLAAIGAGTAPLLQQLDFREALQLHELASEQRGAADAGETQAEAARFALLHARRPIEFVDYFHFYRLVASGGGSAERRIEDATELLRALLPMLFGSLDGPQLPQLPSPEQVRSAIAATLDAQRQIGYPRISLAAQQAALCLDRGAGDLLGQAHAHLRSRVHRQLDAAQAFLKEHPVAGGRLGQDGASVQFRIEGRHQEARVQVEDNVITLLGYRRFLADAGSPAMVGYLAGEL
ncbi:hypothetical protein BA766_06975 [Stenotrophomonas maltophilia]|uniref:hypothetical protein n=1 Tax=Stenotrophomonas maltophilia TaxID=40324 RepID=UPI0008104F81|nr:hypothetical protein [Stenotrophomonas maltophilia]OCK47784.1 hypothetical protein BA766_06975 [Stenotrophomonas maltophilia]